MVIIVHENSDDVDHNLSDGDIDSNHREEGNGETIVSDEIFHTLLGQQYLLFIDDKSTQEDDATTEKSVRDIKEAVLVVTIEIVTDQTEQKISKENHDHGFLESTEHEELDGDDNLFDIGVEKLCVFQQRN